MYAVSICVYQLRKRKEKGKSTHLIVDSDILQRYYLHEGFIFLRGSCPRENHHGIGIAGVIYQRNGR